MTHEIFASSPRNSRCYMWREVFGRKMGLIIPWFIGHIINGCKLPWWLSGKEPAWNAGDAAGDRGLIPGSGRSPGEGNVNPIQYSCLGNPMDRGVWWATVHGVAKSQTLLKWLSTSATWGGLEQWRSKFRRKFSSGGQEEIKTRVQIEG